MTTSSQQDPYSINLNDISISTVTVNSQENYDCISTMAGDYSTFVDPMINIINSVDINTFDTQYEIDFGEDWKTDFPDFYTVKQMCEKYPALNKAFENFKTIYKMVKDDYDKKTRE